MYDWIVTLRNLSCLLHLESFTIKDYKGGYTELDIASSVLGHAPSRDGNSGTGNGYPPGTRPDGDGHGHDFSPAGRTHTRPELRRVWARIFCPARG
jgi:hypothetical protein